jgi:hypothetical protein
MKINIKLYEIFTLLLSVVAIIISIFALSETKKQTKLEKLRTLPRFTIFVRTEQSGRREDLYDTEKIYIINNGEYFRNFEAQTVVIMNVKKMLFKTPMREYNSSYVLNHYYSGHVYNSGSIEIPLIITGYDNWFKYVELDRECISKSDNNCSISISIERYIRIKYVDMYNELQTEYYRVVPIYGCELLTIEKGKNIFLKKENGESLDFDEIDYEKLVVLMND